MRLSDKVRWPAPSFKRQDSDFLDEICLSYGISRTTLMSMCTLLIVDRLRETDFREQINLELNAIDDAQHRENLLRLERKRARLASSPIATEGHANG